ncbi:hypothetical protein FE697_019305 [Mumia zhuanghuii]|uniref:Peptidase M10 metallopeptidase domain-containing protein n=2 Tax=Mumia TaxID=1546255 RepID=A0ABW1QQN7_9ACTN|nr:MULTISPECIES: hypothetical protein [Mumia]KAA1420029.1 hypothetical protein FE697_019305 [Mumia zhuanghuii]
MIIPTGTANVTCAQGQDALLSCQTDNSALTYYMDSGGEYELEAPDRADVQTAMSQYNATDLSVSYDASPTFSGSAETDVVYQEGSTGMSAGTIGMTWCNDPSDNYAYRCDQQYVRIRGNGNITPISAGHETGHAVGLLHGPFAYPSQTVCASVMGIMRSAATCSDSAALGSTVIANINAIY